MMNLLVFITEFTLFFFAVTYTSEIKSSIKSILIYILFAIIPTILIFQFIGQWHGILFLVISSLIFFFIISKTFLVLIHICFVLIIGILSDNIAQFITIDSFSRLLEHYIIFSALFIVFIIIYKISTQTIYKLIGEVKSVLLFTFFISIMTMSTFYINIFLTDYFSQTSILKFNIYIQITYFAILLLILILTVINLKKENKCREIEFETKQFNNYMHSLELINNDMQKFRHDYANILFTMQGYIELNDFKGLKVYFKEHILTAEEDTLKRNKNLASLSKLQVTGIKGLILTKLFQAEKQDIIFNIEIPDVIDEFDMNIVDLARIIGIFFDNAIEASSSCQQSKEINVALFKGLSNSLIFIIENTFDDHSVPIDQLFNDGFSTKKNDRGKGLNTAKRIINSYPNIMLNTNVSSGTFTQIIEINEK
ncbi:sensor histidine kinase [Lysinibacillus sp. NPDC048646]|uniref:sensor histidine kinase n=1 Tax=Lysinibacillus sp. NPDC048646 TaxID=3390574 RepID=UPI003D011F2E